MPFHSVKLCVSLQIVACSNLAMALEAFFAEERSFYEAVNLLQHAMAKPAVPEAPYVEPPWKKLKTAASALQQPAQASSQTSTTPASASSAAAASAELNAATPPSVGSSPQQQLSLEL